MSDMFRLALNIPGSTVLVYQPGCRGLHQHRHKAAGSGGRAITLVSSRAEHS